jgi:UDP-N-acetylglucosamine 3-dehydrogenase
MYTKMGTYRAAIVGLSWIGADPLGPATHPVLGTAIPYSHAAAYAAHPGVEVVAGCDINPEACETFRARWNHRWPGLNTYVDYRELLAKEQVDILSVVTPDNLHRDIVVDAAEAGVRAIFCDKPLATSLADADAMIAAVRARGVAMTINHTRRWGGTYHAAREQVRAGAIGKLAQISAHFGGERAMLFRNHTHFLDLICFFAESDPEWVVAELEPGYEGYGTAYNGDGGRDPSREPAANAYIAFRNGVRAFLGGMKHAVPEVSVDVIGANGRIHVNDSTAARILLAEGGATEQPIIPQFTRAGMQAAVADLINALETGAPTQCEPEEARKAVALALAILESQAKGNAPVAVR